MDGNPPDGLSLYNVLYLRTSAYNQGIISIYLLFEYEDIYDYFKYE